MGAQGTATLDFGAFPGASDASVAVTGQGSILAGSLAEAYLFPAATTDHTADEHLVETIRIVAGPVTAGVGFTIYGFNTNQLAEPVTPPRLARFGGTGQDAGRGKADRQAVDIGGNTPRIYGKWNVGWVWN